MFDKNYNFREMMDSLKLMDSKAEALGLIDAEYDELKTLKKKDIIGYLTSLGIKEKDAKAAVKSSGIGK
jgi:hypothetical protein